MDLLGVLGLVSPSPRSSTTMRTTNGSDDDDCIVGGSGKPGVNVGVGVNGVRGIRGTIGLLGIGVGVKGV